MLKLNADEKRIIWRAMEALDKLKDDPNPSMVTDSKQANHLLGAILTELNKRERAE